MENGGSWSKEQPTYYYHLSTINESEALPTPTPTKKKLVGRGHANLGNAKKHTRAS